MQDQVKRQLELRLAAARCARFSLRLAIQAYQTTPLERADELAIDLALGKCLRRLQESIDGLELAVALAEAEGVA